MNIFTLTPVGQVETAAQAREIAINYQEWLENQGLSYGELVTYAEYFSELGQEFHLTEEFEENGII